MSIATTNNQASRRRTHPERHALPAQLAHHSRVLASLHRVKATLDAGESLWTPVIMLGAGYALTIPAFLSMWGIATSPPTSQSGVNVRRW